MRGSTLAAYGGSPAHDEWDETKANAAHGTSPPRSLPGPMSSHVSSSTSRRSGKDFTNVCTAAQSRRSRCSRPDAAYDPGSPQETRPMSYVRTYTGGCHCGEVRYETNTDLEQVLACNCSICAKRGALWVFVKPENFALRSGGEQLHDYQFNRKVIHHLFCPVCGI